MEIGLHSHLPVTPAAKQTTLVFVLNFFEELRRLAPPK